MSELDIGEIGLEQFHLVSRYSGERQSHFCVGEIDADANAPPTDLLHF